MKPGAVVLLVASLLSIRCGTSPSRPAAMLAEACRFLWTRQADDGGWHSDTHGLLRGGQAWTPFVLHTLMEADHAACAAPPEGLDRALGFLRRHVEAEGVLGLADPDVLEYPNYATAYALRVLVRAGQVTDTARIARMRAYLAGQQFVDRRGVVPDDPAYGSWGFGEQGLPPGRTGHVDLSHTRRVLQALRAASHGDPATYRNAQMFLRIVQKDPNDPRLPDASPFDGGFYASPVVPGTNKSASLSTGAAGVPPFGSYATATADGLLALLAAGVPPRDERVRAAAQWLREHATLAYPEGIPTDTPGQWHRVLFFYHLAVRAEAYDALGEPGDWPDAMARLMAGKQRTDGSFVNPLGAANKEDDPLLATALAVQALGAVVRAQNDG